MMTDRSATIVELPGDGVGPEVTEAARIVLEAAAETCGCTLSFRKELIGGEAIDKTGTALPDTSLAACRDADAILLGAVGGPKWSDPSARVRPEQGLLSLRRELGLFANLRPVTAYAAVAAASPLKSTLTAGVDMLVVRELTGGIYFGERGRRSHESGEVAFDTLIYTTAEIERVVRLAGELARRRRGRVTSVDKANVLESSRLWRATAERVLRDEFSDVSFEHLLVDAAAMHVLCRPREFDVIVTENMFGDILTDEVSVIAGSLGMLPSASLGQGKRGVYEPIHGSAPDIAGRGVANPIGAILSAAMLCRWSLGWEDVAGTIENAVSATLDEGLRTPDICPDNVKPSSTREFEEAVVDHVVSATCSL